MDLPLYLYGLDHAQGGYSVSSLVRREQCYNATSRSDDKECLSEPSA